MPGPLVIGGLMAGGALVGGLLGSRRSGREKEMQRRLVAAANEEEKRAGRLESAAEATRSRWAGTLDAFDPREYMAGEAEAVGDDILEQIRVGDAARRQQLNRRGFYGSTLGTGLLNREVAKRVGRESARLSSRAADLELAKAGQYGQLYGMDYGRYADSSGRFLDLITGTRDYEIARRNDLMHSIYGGAGLGLRAAALG